MSATGPGTKDQRCTTHPEVTLTVHPRRWGWVCRRCRAARQSTPQPYPFVPLPPVRPGHAVPVDLDIRLVPRSAPVPSPEAKLGSLGRVANASALVSSGSRLPDEAGRLFTAMIPCGDRGLGLTRRFTGLVPLP
jgi:hypothetical protein